MTKELTPEGHLDNSGRPWIEQRELLAFAHLTDRQMADKVRMLMRRDLDHEAVCCGARDRIMYLSAALEASRAREARLREALEQAVAWFAEYARGHHEKGQPIKAARNADRARACKAALVAGEASTPAPTDGEKPTC